MRFSSALVSGALVALVSAASSTEAVAPTAVSMSPVQASQDACYKACDINDVNCKAHCVAVPSPDRDQVVKTNECAAKCNQGNGSKADTQAYSDCLQGCIKGNYFETSKGTPDATGGAHDAASQSGSGAVAKPTGSAGSEGSKTGSPSGSDASKTAADAKKTGSKDSGAATLTGSVAAIVGAIAAFVAL